MLNGVPPISVNNLRFPFPLTREAESVQASQVVAHVESADLDHGSHGGRSR